ncbi:hypothetical protein BGZ98_008826 [Dissophora globulifera]|nr:hypothetical protein BGZ98_008826 [Dissophora globulifera]
MDSRTTQANAHAISARATRDLPIISASHLRALQLILSTEANDVHLPPLQRRNARTLQRHYHQQYIDTCLHRSSDSSASSLLALSNSSSSSSTADASRSIIDRVKSRVDKVLEKKRTTRGFVSAIQAPTESTVSAYQMCQEDLSSLSCEPDLDILPVPESLAKLKERSDRYKAEEQAIAKSEAEAEARIASAAAAAAKEERDTSKGRKGKDSPITLNSPKSPGSPHLKEAPTTVRFRESDTKTNGSPPHLDIGTIRTDQISTIDISTVARSAGGSMSNAGSNATTPQLTMRPKYAAYNDDDENDDRMDPVSVPEFRNMANFSNGLDRTSKKRAIEEQQQEEKRLNHFQNRGGFNPPSNNPFSSYNSNNTANHGHGATNTGANLATGGSTGNSAALLKSKMLGTKRPKFKSPINKSNGAENGDDSGRNGQTKGTMGKAEEPQDERLRNIDPKMIEAINNEIMESLTVVSWDDIAGLEHAKKTIKETITWPMLRPDIFTGLRRPPKGLLLFGPPGTGKTMIGKCIASQSKATFFSISSSSLTSKWVGDGEKMVRALFAVARCHQPAVIFMDEIDSLLTQRSDGEIEASRRIKTEFLVQFDGVGVGGEEDRILIVGATNRPQEIDEAARRRFQKRLYIPLPESQGRHGLMKRLLEKQPHDLTADQILDICDRTAGYSGSDMTGLCREAALGPVRAIQGDILEIGLDALRPISHGDFVEALSQVRASVSDRDLDLYKEWDMEYGSMAKA